MQTNVILSLAGLLTCLATVAFADMSGHRLADAKPGAAPPSIQATRAQPTTVNATRPQMSIARPTTAAKAVQQYNARANASLKLASATLNRPVLIPSAAQTAAFRKGTVKMNAALRPKPDKS
jgi:predicted component of type VI protein secretion system